VQRPLGSQDSQVQQTLDAFASLKHRSDSHWTPGGQPKERTNADLSNSLNRVLVSCPFTMKAVNKILAANKQNFTDGIISKIFN